MTTQPEIGMRVIWEPTEDRGTIIAVSPNKKRVQVQWDHPDADSGTQVTMHDIAPHVGLTLCP